MVLYIPTEFHLWVLQLFNITRACCFAASCSLLYIKNSWTTFSAVQPHLNSTSRLGRTCKIFLECDEDIMKIFPGPHLSLYLRYNGGSNLVFVTVGQARLCCCRAGDGDDEVSSRIVFHNLEIDAQLCCTIFGKWYKIRLNDMLNLKVNHQRAVWSAKLLKDAINFGNKHPTLMWTLRV